jgi:hypothetical protein
MRSEPDQLAKPDDTINETMLLSSMAKSSKFYRSIINQNIKSWFFRDASNRAVFEEMNRLIEQLSHEEYMPVLLGKSGDISDMFREVLKRDAMFYINLEEEMLCVPEMADIYSYESREHHFDRIMHEMRKSLSLGQHRWTR